VVSPGCAAPASAPARALASLGGRAGCGISKCLQAKTISGGVIRPTGGRSLRLFELDIFLHRIFLAAAQPSWRGRFSKQIQADDRAPAFSVTHRGSPARLHFR
jgi:hypothetical protein